MRPCVSELSPPRRVSFLWRTKGSAKFAALAPFTELAKSALFVPGEITSPTKCCQYPATGAMASSASNPGIIYALVARGTCVLAEFTTTSGNFTTVTRRILEKLPSDDSKMSYARLRVTAKAATPLCACATARASLSSRGRRS